MGNDFSIRINDELLSYLWIDKKLQKHLDGLSEDLQDIIEDDISSSTNGKLKTMSSSKRESCADKFASDDASKFIKMEVITKLIDNLLLVQYAKKKGFGVTDDTLIEEELLRRSDRLTILGYSKDEIRKEVEDEFIVSCLLESIYRDISSVDEHYLRSYYEANRQFFSYGEAVRVRHIFLESSLAHDMDEEKEINDRGLYLLARIREGEDFSFIAKEFSYCPSALRGGDLGFIYRGALDDTEFEDSLFLLDINTPTGLIKSSYGYHIVDVVSKVDNFIPPFDSIKDSVGEVICNKIKAERKDDLISHLWSEASIEYIEIKN